jgi:hypothetical protein
MARLWVLFWIIYAFPSSGFADRAALLASVDHGQTARLKTLAAALMDGRGGETAGTCTEVSATKDHLFAREIVGRKLGARPGFRSR